MKRKWEKDAGLTIVELLILVAVLTILLTIAFPHFDRSNFYLQAEGRTLYNDIRSVKFMRMTQGEDYNILLSSDHYKVRIGTNMVKTVRLMNHHKLLYSDNQIMFSYQGVPLYGGDTIRLYNEQKNKYKKITIVPASGRVLLYEEIFYGE